MITIYIYIYIYIYICKWALRDLKKKILDRQSETCRKSSSSRKYTDLGIKIELLTITKFMPQISNFHTDYIPFYIFFLTFRFFVESQCALRDLKYFFLTNNLRLVKKIPAPGNMRTWGSKCISQKTPVYAIK